MPGGSCCWLDLCCPPDSPQQHAALAAHLGITEDAAAKVLHEFRLVPRDVPASLHRVLDAELRGHLHAKGEATGGE